MSEDESLDAIIKQGSENQGHSNGSGTILKKSNFVNRTNAQDLIQKAEAQAAEIIKSAEAEKDKIFEESRAAGHAKGLGEASRYFASLYKKQQDDIPAFEQKLNDMILDGIAKIAGQMDVGQQAAQSAKLTIQELGLREALILRVPSSAVESALEHLADIPSDIIKIIPDPSADATESYLETPYGHIALSVEQQIKAIREGLGTPVSDKIRQSDRNI